MKTYAIPFILWAAACIGLVVALLADGSIEIVGTALTSFPLFVVLLRSRSRVSINSTEKVAS